MVFSLLAKLLTFAQSLVISYAFGVQRSTDILFYVLSLVFLLTAFICSINQQVIVPVTIDIRNNISEEESRKFVSYIYFIYLIIGIIGTLLLFISPAKTLSLFSSFSIQDIQANEGILRYIIPSFLLIILNTFILDIFNSYKYFVLPMILDMIKNLVIIIFVITFKCKLSVLSLALGIFAGNIAQFVILNILLVYILKWKFSLKYFRIDNLVKKNIMYVFIGQIATFANSFITMYLLSGFSAGVYSAMDYSQKISTILSSVIIVQISTVIGVNFIELYTQANFDKLNELFVTYLKMGLFVIMPFCFIMSLNSEPIISLIFERGNFTHEAVKLTSAFFRYFILMIPPMLIGAFIVRMVIAKQIQRTAFLWQFFNNLISAIIIYILIKAGGYYGYAVGTLVSYTVYTVMLMLFLLRTEFDFIDYSSVMKVFLVNVILNSLIMSCTYFMVGGIPQNGSTYSYSVFILESTAIYSVLFLISSNFIGVNKKILQKIFSYLASVMRKKENK